MHKFFATIIAATAITAALPAAAQQQAPAAAPQQVTPAPYKGWEFQGAERQEVRSCLLREGQKRGWGDRLYKAVTFDYPPGSDRPRVSWKGPDAPPPEPRDEAAKAAQACVLQAWKAYHNNNRRGGGQNF